MFYEDSDEIIAVQCKNTKTPVGRPVLQKLHSVMKMHNYENITFDRGFVVLLVASLLMLISGLIGT